MHGTGPEAHGWECGSLLARRQDLACLQQVLFADHCELRVGQLNGLLIAAHAVQFHQDGQQARTPVLPCDFPIDTIIKEAVLPGYLKQFFDIKNAENESVLSSNWGNLQCGLYSVSFQKIVFATFNICLHYGYIHAAEYLLAARKSPKDDCVFYAFDGSFKALLPGADLNKLRSIPVKTLLQITLRYIIKQQFNHLDFAGRCSHQRSTLAPEVTRYDQWSYLPSE